MSFVNEVKYLQFFLRDKKFAENQTLSRIATFRKHQLEDGQDMCKKVLEDACEKWSSELEFLELFQNQLPLLCKKQAHFGSLIEAIIVRTKKKVLLASPLTKKIKKKSKLLTEEEFVIFQNNLLMDSIHYLFSCCVFDGN